MLKPKSRMFFGNSTGTHSYKYMFLEQLGDVPPQKFKDKAYLITEN